MTTGEVLLPEVSITEAAGGRIRVHARIQHTFPLEIAEIMRGDGAQTFRKTIPLNETTPSETLHSSLKRKVATGSGHASRCGMSQRMGSVREPVRQAK